MTQCHFEVTTSPADLAALRACAYRHGEECARADYADGSRYLNVADFDFEAWLGISAPAETEQALSDVTTDDQATARSGYQQAFEDGYRAALRTLMQP